MNESQKYRKMKEMMKKIILILLLIILISMPCFALQYHLKFVWDANTEPDLKGYTLYYRNLIESEWIKITDISSDLTQKEIYFDTNNSVAFSMTAYDTSFLESDFSNEVYLFVDSNIPLKPADFAIVYALPYAANQYHIKFTWTANIETDLAGYRLYYRDFVGSEFIKIKDISSDSIETEIYFDTNNHVAFCLTAFDTSMLESDHSNEMFLMIDMIAPSVPQNFNVQIIDIDQ